MVLLLELFSSLLEKHYSLSPESSSSPFCEDSLPADEAEGPQVHNIQSYSPSVSALFTDFKIVF